MPMIQPRTIHLAHPLDAAQLREPDQPTPPAAAGRTPERSPRRVCGTCSERAARSRPRRGVLLAFVVAVALAAVGTSQAHAGTINVWSCHGPSGEVAPLDGWSSQVTGGVTSASSCAGWWVGSFGIAAAPQPHPRDAFGAWTFTAPPNTAVTGLRYLRTVAVAGSADYTSFRGTDAVWDSRTIESCAALLGCSGYVGQEATWDGLGGQPGVMLDLRACTADGGCDGGSYGWLTVTYAVVSLQDSQAPTFSAVTGPLTSGDVLQGNADLEVQLADAGTGLDRLHATVDGTPFDDHVIDLNGGRCGPVSGERDFEWAVPCALHASASTTLATASLVDGSHRVRVDVEDASGNTTTVFDASVVTHNAPESAAVPEISGTARVGVRLRASPGDWWPQATMLVYEWMRCPTSGDSGSCVAIAGATGTTYTPTAADAYGRVRVRVTASNVSGSQDALSAASDVIVDAQGQTVAPAPAGASSSAPIVTPAVGPSVPVAGHVPSAGTAAGARVRVALAVHNRPGDPGARLVRATRTRPVVISGQVLAPNGQPLRGVLVTLQARHPGSAWKRLRTVRTGRDGRFTAAYRFSTTTSHESLRAVVARNASQPFAGASRPCTVLLAP